MHPRVAAFLALVCLLPSATLARHPKDRGTGLAAIHYARVPPDFAYDAGAGSTRLSSSAGKPVVINFWATWCRPCLDELPAFAQVQQTYGPAVTVLTLSAEAPGVAKSFLQQKNLALPLVEDPAHAIFDAYTVSDIPVTLVLDRKGAVEHVSVGQLDWNELHAAVEAALGPAALGP